MYGGPTKFENVFDAKTNDYFKCFEANFNRNVRVTEDEVRIELFSTSVRVFTLVFLNDFSAQNIHTEADWDIVFTILECVGAGATPPEFEDVIVPNFGKIFFANILLPAFP